MRLRAGGDGARIRRRRPGPGDRWREALAGGGREVEFGAVDGIYRAAARDGGEVAIGPSAGHRPSARPAARIYTAGGQVRALFETLVGRRVDLFA